MNNLDKKPINLMAAVFKVKPSKIDKILLIGILKVRFFTPNKFSISN